MTAIRDKWREGRVRPLQGNAPPDRPVSRGVLSFRSVCDPAFSATSTFPTTIPGPPICVFEAWRNLSLRCGFQNQPQSRSLPPPAGRLRPRTKERTGRITLFSSSAMSSDRLFLDQVGRHQSPSPLHRHTQTNTPFQKPGDKHDISTLPGGRHFYFALTLMNLCCGSKVRMSCLGKVEMSS